MAARPPLGRTRATSDFGPQPSASMIEDPADNDNNHDEQHQYSEVDDNQAERDAIEAGRRLAQEQQQRLLQQHSESSANRQHHNNHHMFAAASSASNAAGGVATPSATSGTASVRKPSSSSAAPSSASITEIEQLRKNLLQTTAMLDKERAKGKEMQVSISTMQVEMTAMKRELAVVHRVSAPGGAGPAAVSSHAKEVATLKRQLQLAQNEIELLKGGTGNNNNNNLLGGAVVGTAAVSGAGVHSAGSGDEQTVKLRSEIRSLESQRAELLNVVKRQNRLIDVLRRQKMHLEAAKVLQITEDEFRRSLAMENR